MSDISEEINFIDKLFLVFSNQNIQIKTLVVLAKICLFELT